MIAKIQSPFMGETLNRKIEYQLEKIESGVARELHNSSGDSLANMYRNMSLVADLNDRVKSPYIEFILSSPIGEEVPDEKFMELAKEYLDKMGYGDSCYTVIKNDDKDHQHVHVLATTIDLNGAWISDSYSKGRSGRIMRELELKYDLEIMEKGKSCKSITLGESQYRQFFFDTALHKALRSRNAKERVNALLKQSDTFNVLNLNTKKAYTNTEWRIILGDDIYEKILEMLAKGKFFNPLLKDELLSVMDRLHKDCKNVKEFRDRLEKEGYYMRLVSDKGKSHYVYGISDRGFYVKDTALPEPYRFGKLLFAGNQMTADEQKHFLYNQIFILLHESSNYEDFRNQLANNNIKLIEHVNSKGIYGISYVLLNVDSPEIYKSSDISKRLTYRNIQDYFLKEQKSEQETNREQEFVTAIDSIIVCIANNPKEWERDISYMYPAMMLSNVFDGVPGKKRRTEDELPTKKKKRKRKGLTL